MTQMLKDFLLFIHSEGFSHRLSEYFSDKEKNEEFIRIAALVLTGPMTTSDQGYTNEERRVLLALKEEGFVTHKVLKVGYRNEALWLLCYKRILSSIK